MKTTLMIEASGSVLARILAMIDSDGGASGVTIDGATVPGGSNGDDNEAGDTPAVPGQVDGSGLPWDDRIHSTPAKLTTKNAWRAKRGVTSAEVAAVEAELRARAPQPVMTAPVPVPMAPVPAPTMPMPAGYPAPVPVPMAPAPAPVMVAPVPAPQPVPVPVPVQQQAAVPATPAPVQHFQPVAPPPPATVDFAGFMGKVATLVASGQADGDYFNNLCQRINTAFGAVVANSIADFQTNQQVLDYAIQTMASEGRWV